ncbi:chloride channel protein [Sulfobacillus harzensis]|uniref:Chloride channel protein n=1 Tax=Sulfobacillus harzensis TaxID=2729629 RepID=A0A7Y0Q3I4_9FIRM|nr:chloride channel protein [Sulfobacillus harzensis]NMP24288.1 hypothetical protein [Sulfobacillus harzensis]
MMGILREVQHLAFQYQVGPFARAVARTSDGRRVVVLMLDGLVTGVGLYAMRRFLGGSGGQPTEVVWTRSGRLSFLRTLLSGALSEITVGMGASLGREAAPQHLGAAWADVLARWTHLPKEQRALLIASGAGAGLGAVYNVPLAGAAFALEIYLGTISLPLALPAMLASAVATAVSWIALPNHVTYLVPPLSTPSGSLLIFSLLVGPVMGLLSGAYIRLVVWAHDHQPRHWALALEPMLRASALGLVAMKYPLVLGNGRDLAQFAFTGSAGLATYAALTGIKPLATVGTLRSGASGGLFTPTLSVGAVSGALLGHLWIHLAHGAWNPGYALVGAAAMLGAAMEAPVTAILFVLELTRTIDAIMVPLLIGALSSTMVARHLDWHSIYSARLPERQKRASDQGDSMSSHS